MFQVSGSKTVDKKGCQNSDTSEANRNKKLRQQQTVASSNKDVGNSECQTQRLLRDRAVDGRASQAVSTCSYRLSLVFIGSSSSRNFRHRLTRALSKKHSEISEKSRSSSLTFWGIRVLQGRWKSPSMGPLYRDNARVLVSWLNIGPFSQYLLKGTPAGEPLYFGGPRMHLPFTKSVATHVWWYRGSSIKSIINHTKA